MQEVNKETRKTQITIRKIQAGFLGLFTLGVSMMMGDIAGYMDSPISVFSITTTMFGLMGSIMCEIISRKAERW